MNLKSEKKFQNVEDDVFSSISNAHLCLRAKKSVNVMGENM